MEVGMFSVLHRTNPKIADASQPALYLKCKLLVLPLNIEGGEKHPVLFPIRAVVITFAEETR